MIRFAKLLRVSFCWIVVGLRRAMVEHWLLMVVCFTVVAPWPRLLGMSRYPCVFVNFSICLHLLSTCFLNFNICLQLVSFLFSYFNI